MLGLSHLDKGKRSRRHRVHLNEPHVFHIRWSKQRLRRTTVASVTGAPRDGREAHEGEATTAEADGRGDDLIP